MLYGLVMAGSSDISARAMGRTPRPNQLVDLADSEVSIRFTMDRLKPLMEKDRIFVVTHRRLGDAINRELPSIPSANIIIEPYDRNAAPSIGLVAHLLYQRDPEATMVVLPADKTIEPKDLFVLAIRYAEQMVEQDPLRIVAFGKKPTYPAECYGYVERGQSLTTSTEREIGTFFVKRFRQKPDATTAKSFFDSGDFFWNSDIFVWKAKGIVEILQKHEPKLSKRLKAITNATGKDQYEDCLAEQFEMIEPVSIDTAILQHAAAAIVIEAPFAWSDGSEPVLQFLPTIE